jgi:hypothetical protein
MYKNTYVLKLVLNIVIAGIEALFVSGKKFLSACVKQSAACELSHVFKPYINSLVDALSSQPIFQAGKQVVVALSKIRAVRRVVKQLPVEMLQQCWSASSCMWICVVMKHYTRYQCSMPFVLNGPMQFFQCFTVHF